ncbi:ABC-type dipeptide transport system [Klebsiella pneumoniae subsp. ozaenae]|uniref:ABC-type dipeptide transport system n=1 Tax=Klebsiella pneumoniae subsp. ozaenae TaxID=574 RepID=A0A377ZKH2_KLEPO|nr:ABC-type dipeptide transport system [Klebsiella pneumoniae subsp. ozaenae]
MHRHFRLPALAALFLTGAFSVWAADTPVKGGTLIYLEQQPHTNLYPPAGGFYPNGGILNQITDKLTWQNPKTLEIEPWIAESWTSNADKTEYTFHPAQRGHFLRWHTAGRRRRRQKTSIPMVWEIKPIACPSQRSSITTSAAK